VGKFSAMSWIIQVFMVSILWCSWSGDHPYDDLARFGYRLDIKVEKNSESSIFLAIPTGTYHKNLAIRKLFFVK
jgi:hypothetical protein